MRPGRASNPRPGDCLQTEVARDQWTAVRLLRQEETRGGLMWRCKRPDATAPDIWRRTEDLYLIGE